MSFDIYKKRLQINGGSMVGEHVRDTEIFMAQNFKDDPSYKVGILKKSDLTNIEIELRVVNTDKPHLKKMYLIPNNISEIGDYISFVKNDKVRNYLVTGFEDNLISGCAYVKECNQLLRLPSGKTYPCIVSNDSYGSKTNLSNDFIGEVDTKAKIEVQANIDTLSECDLDVRYMFNNSKFDIFKTNDINTSINKGLITMINKKDNYLPTLDKLEDNYCYQGKPDNQPTEEYIIMGNDNIIINKEYTYSIEPFTDVVFELDEYSVSNNIAEIINSTNYSCTIIAYKTGEFIELSTTVDGNKVTKNITTSKY